MKARKLFWDKYLKEDWSKYIHWWSCFQRRKNEKQKKTPESEKYVTTFSSEVGFTYQLRIASGDLSLQIECIGHQNETKVHL